jgi:hypothetical protein
MLLLPKTVFIGEHVNVIIICLHSVLHACQILYNFAIFVHGSQKPTHKTKGSELGICVCVCAGMCKRKLGFDFSLRRRRLGFGFMCIGQGWRLDLQTKVRLCVCL